MGNAAPVPSAPSRLATIGSQFPLVPQVGGNRNRSRQWFPEWFPNLWFPWKCGNRRVVWRGVLRD